MPDLTFTFTSIIVYLYCCIGMAIEDALYVEGIPSYKIVDQLTGRALYRKEDQLKHKAFR